MAEMQRELVIPGDLLDDSGRLRPGANTYREKGAIYAARLGLKEVRGDTVGVLGLSGRYDPQRGDMVIGTVVEVGPSNWYINVGAAGDVGMHVNDVPWRVEFGETSKYLKAGDTVLLKINHVDELKKAQVSMKDRQARKLAGGLLLDVTPTKVPRIIGRNGSMITMVKNLTNTRMFVGQNGVIWIDGDPKDVQLAMDAIRKIEAEAHTSGLTDKVRDWLKANGAKGDEAVGVDDERAYGSRFEEREETEGGAEAEGAAPREERRGGFRDREERGGFRERRGGFRDREERGEGGFRGGERGGFREREERSEGGFRDREPRGEGGFRGGERGGFREREERGAPRERGERGGFREREERSEGGFRGGERGGFREREERGAPREREERGGFREREDRGAPREERGGFREREERPRFREADEAGDAAPRSLRDEVERPRAQPEEEDLEPGGVAREGERTEGDRPEGGERREGGGRRRRRRGGRGRGGRGRDD